MDPSFTGIVGFKFSGENWKLWLTRGMFFFIANDLWGVVSCEEKRSVDVASATSKSSKKDEEEDGKAQREFDRRSAKALSLLVMAVSDDVLMSCGIGAMPTACAAWRKLEATYAAKTLMNRLLLH